MEGELSRLILEAAGGAALLTLGSLAAVGGRRTLSSARGLGLAGPLLALFVGATVDRLSVPLVETAPYTDLFRSAGDLRVQALMEDADLRTRTNVDPRLRYIPIASERVPNLESAYRLDAGPLRPLEFPALRHTSPITFPRGVEPRSDHGDPAVLRQEVAGLYEAAQATVGESEDGAVELLRSTSVGFLALGLMGFVAGVLPLAARLIAALYDSLRLVWATREAGYRGARGRAIRLGTAALADWHFRRSRPFVSLATFGTLTLLGGALLGFVREDATRRIAHRTFTEARHLRIEGKGRR